MALLIMFNNWFHDLATGIWFSSMALTMFIYKKVKEEGSPEVLSFFGRYRPKLLNTNLISLILIFVFGTIRAFAYFDYEYLPAVGHNQVTALIIKHIFLIGAAVTGIYWQHIMRNKQNQEG